MADAPQDEDDLGVDAPEAHGDVARGPIVELMRKVAFAGLGALFMTEEGLRSLAGQLKLPKEALGFVLSQAERTKDEVGRVLSEELRRFLRSDKLRGGFPAAALGHAGGGDGPRAAGPRPRAQAR